MTVQLAVEVTFDSTLPIRDKRNGRFGKKRDNFKYSQKQIQNHTRPTRKVIEMNFIKIQGN